MKINAPDGFTTNGLLYFGKSLSRETYLSKGVRLEVPDVRNADSGTRTELRRQNNLLLGFLGDHYALQTHWVVEDDYYSPIQAYENRTTKGELTGIATRWATLTRRGREMDAKNKLAQGELRRERVYLYFARKCDSLDAADLTSVAAYEKFLAQQARNFENKVSRVQDIFSFSKASMMGDADHALHYRKFLNPSLSCYWAGDPVDTMADFDPSASILQNCARGDGVPFKIGRDDSVALKMDHMYHTLFVIRRLPPRGTRLGMLGPLLNAETKGYCITQNIYPLDLDQEIKLTEDERAELLKYINDPKHYGVRDEIRRKEAKILSLLVGHTIPFDMLMVLRVWAPTIEQLQGKCISIKTGLSGLGVGYHQVNNCSQARNLFYETYPGWLGGRYRDWDLYVENKNLRDLLPFSSTFTGHLETAEAIYDTPTNGLAGIRLFVGDTPQHAALIGMNGAGKSNFIIDLLSQTDDQSGFTAIFEEGLAYGAYAQLRGMQSVVLRAGSNYTYNLFDTFGLPLSDQNIREAVALAMRLIGKAKDEDKNNQRSAIISEYINKLYSTHVKTWKNADEGRFMGLCQRAAAIEEFRAKEMQADTTFLEAFAEFRDLEQQNSAAVAERLSRISEEETVKFANQRDTADIVRSMVVSQFTPDEYPQFSGLWSLMKNGRMEHHKGIAMSEQIDYLVSLLAKGKRVGGTVGRLIDGVSNQKWTNTGVHVEFGYLEEGELKEIAGFLFPTRVRQYIVTRPRAERKRVILEELRRFLLIPNAKETVRECYGQFRKFRAWTLSAFQQASQIDEIDSSLLEIILGNSKQYFLMRQNSESEVDRFGDIIKLPRAARRPILEYPLIEHQRGKKASYFTLFSREGGVPVCGTVQVAVNPYMLYVASSNGSTFDERSRTLGKYKDPFDGVVTEVDKKLAGSGSPEVSAA